MASDVASNSPRRLVLRLLQFARDVTRLCALRLEMPSVLLEDLNYHILEMQLPGGPRAEEVGQEVPTTVPGPN